MKRWILALGMGMVCAVTSLVAQEVFSANDLDPANLVETKTWGNFKIAARSDKNVTIEAMDVPREAPDKELFNNRIKLNGAGAAEYRAVVLTVKQKGEVVVYCNSSSKTDARILLLVDLSSGQTVAELSAEPDTGTKAGLVKASLPAAGTYALYSKSGGINIYQIVIR